MRLNRTSGARREPSTARSFLPAFHATPRRLEAPAAKPVAAEEMEVSSDDDSRDADDSSDEEWDDADPEDAGNDGPASATRSSPVKKKLLEDNTKVCTRPAAQDARPRARAQHWATRRARRDAFKRAATATARRTQ